MHAVEIPFVYLKDILACTLMLRRVKAEWISLFLIDSDTSDRVVKYLLAGIPDL